jgi:hypothetical protein
MTVNSPERTNFVTSISSEIMFSVSVALELASLSALSSILYWAAVQLTPPLIVSRPVRYSVAG